MAARRLARAAIRPPVRAAGGAGAEPHALPFQPAILCRKIPIRGVIHNDDLDRILGLIAQRSTARSSISARFRFGITTESLKSSFTSISCAKRTAILMRWFTLFTEVLTTEMRHGDGTVLPIRSGAAETACGDSAFT